MNPECFTEGFRVGQRSVRLLQPLLPGSIEEAQSAFEICPRPSGFIHRRSLGQFDAQHLECLTQATVRELARARYPTDLVSGGSCEIDSRRRAHDRTHLMRPRRLRSFEGAFIRDNVIIRADILEPDGWGAWKLVEVKNSGSVKSYQLADVASQSWVLAGNNICSVFRNHTPRQAARRVCLRNSAHALCRRGCDDKN